MATHQPCLQARRLTLRARAGLGALLLAAGTGAYFGSLYSPDRKQYQAVAGNNGRQNNYQGPSQSLTDISGIPGLFERLIANPQPASGEDHEKRDLAAQESMSVWAFWMVIVAAFSAVVTTVGTIFLYKQIKLTREAVEDTGLATAAMERQTEIARETLKNANRPWIKIGYIAIEPLGPDQTRILVGIVNIGRSSATIVSSHAQFWRGRNLPMIRPYQQVEGTVKDPAPVLHPGQSKDEIFDIEQSVDLTAPLIRGGSGRVYIMGWIRYLDHEIPRRTMFCRVYDPQQGRFVPTNDPDYEVQH